MSLQSEHSWDADAHGWQEILNAVKIPHMRTQRDASTPIPVRTRIDSARDGIEQRDTLTLGWTNRAVRIELRDPRWRIAAVWVPAGDVERR